MFPYFAILAVFSGLTVSSWSKTSSSPIMRVFALLSIGLLVAMVGLRDEIGPDWARYLFHFRRDANSTVLEIIGRSDPAYHLLSWFVAKIGLNLYALNTICAATLIYGVASFSKKLPLPGLSFLTAVPYLIIVVGMGYTRQSVAIGLLLIALTQYRQNRKFTAIMIIVFGSLFHKATIIMLPFIALSATKNRAIITGLVAVMIILIYNFLIADQFDDLVYTYIEREYSSSGTIFRIALLVIPSTLFLLFWKRFKALDANNRIWLIFALAAYLTIPAYLLSPSSTVIDRLALYLIPIQLYVVSWLPVVFGKKGKANLIIVGGIIVYNFLVLFLWLNFAGHIEAWLPYKWILS